MFLKTHLFKVAFIDNNIYPLNGFYRYVIWGIIILHIICTAPLNGSYSMGALLNIHYNYYYYKLSANKCISHSSVLTAKGYNKHESIKLSDPKCKILYHMVNLTFWGEIICFYLSRV